MALGPDLGKWQYWWEFNKDRYLRLRDAVDRPSLVAGSDESLLGRGGAGIARDSLRPTDAEIRKHVLPALLRTLEETEQRDITSSCLIALAKIARCGDAARILAPMRAHLRSRDQEVRETAALAMGISRRIEALPDLLALAGDLDAGRQLCDRAEVDARTRAFACYGLGLVGAASDRADVQDRIQRRLVEILRDDSVVSLDVKVAAMQGIRGLRVDATAGPRHKLVAWRIQRALEDYYARDLGRSMEIVQAHVPLAVSSLLASEADRTRAATHFAADLPDAAGRHIFVRQSIALALGRLARPPETSPAHRRFSAALLEYSQRGKDEQTRAFATIALGHIGGPANEQALIQRLREGSKALERPWAALALGVMAFERRARGSKSEARIGRALLRAMRDTKNPDTLAAIAVGLGLAGHRKAAPQLRDLLLRNLPREELAGYLCIGLALMEDRGSIPTIRDVVLGSTRRPTLLMQASVALGRLGDKQAADVLLEQLAADRHNLAVLSSIASALASIGDRRTIAPLVRLLRDSERPFLARAFAAVALGGVGESDPLPWNERYAAGINYRAAVETLTNGSSGVLDLL